MKIKDVMTRGVEVVRPDASLKDAALKMKTLDVGPLPVVDGDRLVGFVTDRDIVIRGTAEGRDPATTRVREVMTDEVHLCYEDDDVTKAVRLMEAHNIRRVPVLDREQRLVGILSLGDLANERSGEAGEVLADVSKAAPQR